MDKNRLIKLIDMYFDGGLTESSKLELERLLQSWPRARELFWGYAELHAMLRQQGQESWGHVYAKTLASENSANPAKHWKSRSSVLVVTATTLALCLLLIVGLSMIDDKHPAMGPEDALPASSHSLANQSSSLESAGAANVKPPWIATLRKAIDVQWTDKAQAPRVGEPLIAGRIQFESGLVEIQTSRGALMLVEGPADLELVSEMQVRCHQGRLRVDVPPPAHGFVVNTALVDVVDLGTSFAMQVSGEQEAQVHVIEGLVELHPQMQQVSSRTIRRGESVSLGEAGTIEDIPPELSSFPTLAEMESRTRNAEAQSLDAWKRQRTAISQNPSCLLYFDFEKSLESETVMPNLAQGAQRASDGTIIGCTWTEGRWPGKRALDFKNVADRVRFALPAEHHALTCIASIRVDALEHAFNALLMSGDAVVGEIQWQISLRDDDVGRMRLGRRPRPGWGFVEDYMSEPIFKREQFGTWLHLAIVWDTERRTYSQFLNGELITNGVTTLGDLPNANFLRTGELEIGNWTPKVGQPMEPIRNFCGRIDEFAIFNRALSPEEIRAHHQLTMTLGAVHK